MRESSEIEAVNAASPSATHGQATALLLAIIVAVTVFIALLVPFGIYDFWGGILFLFYWSSIEQMKFERIPASLAGALVGLGIAYMFMALPQAMAPLAGAGIALLVIVLAVYCLIMGWLAFFINKSTMLFLTVAGIPEIQHHASFGGAAIALVVGAVFFCGLIKAGMHLTARRGQRRAIGG